MSTRRVEEGPRRNTSELWLLAASIGIMAAIVVAKPDGQAQRILAADDAALDQAVENLDAAIDREAAEDLALAEAAGIEVAEAPGQADRRQP
jgi:hypothetical protein